MSYEENTNYFSYQGVIGRKNYVINMFVVVGLYIALTMINFDFLNNFISYKLIFSILAFTIQMLKFVLIFSAISLIYRRFTDITLGKSYNFNLNARRIFVLFYVFPVLYFLCIKYFLDIIPFLIVILDNILYFVILPLSLIITVVIAFIKSCKK